MSRTTWKVLGWAVFTGMLMLLPADRPTVACPVSWISIGERMTDGRARSGEKSKPKARLPKYFAQLKLDDNQRQQILEIQERYATPLKGKQELLNETPA